MIADRGFNMGTGQAQAPGMRAGTSRLAIALATIGLGLGLATGVQAAEAEIGSGDIVVTGAVPDDYTVEGQSSSTRLDISLRETPQSVSVVSRAQIEDFNLDTVRDVLRRTTGVNVETFDSERTYYNARGFDIVSFQYDGVGMPLAQGIQIGAADTALFERVEIVRGATGLLSQTGNPSATINFVRKRAKRETGGYATLSYGSFDQVRGDVDVNAALTENGGLRARFVGAYESADSYLDYYSTSRLTLYGTVSADLGPDTVATVGYSWQESAPKGVTWGALPVTDAEGNPASYDRSTSSAQPWTNWTSTDRQLFADITHDLGNDWQAKVSVQRRAFDGDAELFYIYYSGDTLVSYPGAYKDHQRDTTIDAHIGGSFELAGREHEVLFGGTYGEQRLIESQASAPDSFGIPLPGDTAFQGTFPYPDFGDYAVAADYTTKIYTGYGLARLSLAEPLKLMLGGNVARAERNGVSYGTPYNFAKTKFLPFAGVTLDLTGNLTAYASYATIFNPQVETDIDGNVLAPLEGETYEAGIKGEWLEGRLNASLAVFKTKQDNVARQAGFNPDLGINYYTAEDNRSQGVEFDVSGELLPGLQLTGGYAYVDIEDDAGEDARLFIPRHTVRLTAAYTPPALEALRLGASARYQSKIENGVTQGDYALVDLMARYQLTPNISLGANVDNVTGVKYWSSLQSAQAYYGAPRTVRGTLGLSF
ncbi:TonB-dependent siderophore receptor [Novosphingobium sp. YJ-S2-02]|uniref:TonB-dependent siderophore receptor n=1 Tax=Novosphingobium aureum TaxID=2792964 RepID=A0A931HDX1_9SPHN|nr:TonB-dependent siderophore receptor [Novosphingobium aureum]MBH0114032.1 TonB-dependent siderophore receptor [Novosphingobium aureum]